MTAKLGRKIMKMRRVLKMVLFLVCCLAVNFAYAYAPYPDYLGGNKNFIICGGHMGIGWYLDKSSLVVQEYNPPTYRIAVNVLSVEHADEGNITPYQTETEQYLYDWNKKAMYKLNDKGWRYIPPVGSMAETGHHFSGEMAFYIAYHMKFYGGQRWRNPHTGNYERPNFSDALYSLVDNAE